MSAPDEWDGSIYAEPGDCRVWVRPKRTGDGTTMGGPIAEAQNQETAVEIAHRCQMHDHLVDALKEARRAVANGLEFYGEDTAARATLEKLDAVLSKASECRHDRCRPCHHAQGR